MGDTRSAGRNYARMAGRLEGACFIALSNLKWGDTVGAATVLAKALADVDDGDDAMGMLASAFDALVIVTARSEEAA